MVSFARSCQYRKDTEKRRGELILKGIEVVEKVWRRGIEGGV